MGQVFYLTQAIKDKCPMGSFLREHPPTRSAESKRAGSYNTEKQMIQKGKHGVRPGDKKGEEPTLGPAKGLCKDSCR